MKKKKMKKKKEEEENLHDNCIDFSLLLTHSFARSLSLSPQAQLLESYVSSTWPSKNNFMQSTFTSHCTVKTHHHHLYQTAVASCSALLRSHIQHRRRCGGELNDTRKELATHLARTYSIETHRTSLNRTGKDRTLRSESRWVVACRKRNNG